MESFKNIDTWVFDLDNTLYPRHCDLFSQIDKLMTDYVSRLTGFDRVEARKLQKDLYRDYGTTMRGLMETREIDPHDFLDYVHDIDYSELPPNPGLAELLVALPGRRIVYTNGSVKHAKNTLAALGINEEIFEGFFDIVSSGFEPKPGMAPFRNFLKDLMVDGTRAAMFEDIARNLEPAKQHGMLTVLITPQEGGNYTMEEWEKEASGQKHVDYETNNLEKFLKEVLKVIA